MQKLLAMIPTEEEKQRILEAQLAQPDIPLGPAEQFLLTMASISELGARLQLWAFKMDYESMEKVINRKRWVTKPTFIAGAILIFCHTATSYFNDKSLFLIENSCS